VCLNLVQHNKSSPASSFEVRSLNDNYVLINSVIVGQFSIVYTFNLASSHAIDLYSLEQLRLILKDETSHYVCPRTSSQHKSRNKLKLPLIYRARKEYT